MTSARRGGWYACGVGGATELAKDGAARKINKIKRIPAGISTLQVSLFMLAGSECPITLAGGGYPLTLGGSKYPLTLAGSEYALTLADSKYPPAEPEAYGFRPLKGPFSQPLQKVTKIDGNR
jgi:hypothetical protein